MKLAVVGGREFTDYEFVKSKIQEYPNVTMIISGGRRKDKKGVDTHAVNYAIEAGIPFKEFYPDWETHGITAGPIRNKDIITEGEEVLAIWDGKSKGTLSSINIAKSQGKSLRIERYVGIK